MTETRYLLATIAVIAALAVPAVSHATSGAAYPPAAASVYMKSCKAQAKVAANGKVSPARIATYCACTLHYLEAHLTYPQFRAAGRAAVTLTGGTAKAKAAFKGAIKSCVP